MATTTDVSTFGNLGGPAADQQGRALRSRAPGWVRTIGFTATVLALTTASVTFLILLGLTPIVVTPDLPKWALLINGVIVAVLLGALAWELATLWVARKRGVAGARLHVSVVLWFSAIAAIPAILVAVVASLTLSRSLDNLFSDTTQNVVAGGVQIGNAYVEAMGQRTLDDLSVMRAALEPLGDSLANPQFESYFDRLTLQRNLNGAFIVSSAGSVLVSSVSDSDPPNAPIKQEAIDAALEQAGRPILIEPGPGDPDGFGGMLALGTFPEGAVLFIVRNASLDAMTSIASLNATALRYNLLEAVGPTAYQMQFGILYFGFALVVLLSASWVGLAFASRLVAPLRGLIDAAEDVARGDLSVEVPVRRADGDMGALGRSFNKMTTQLQGQRRQLLTANEQIDSRRRFMEAVLSGISAGVVGVDGRGNVTVVNRAGHRLLNLSAISVGRPIGELVPELAPILASAWSDDRREHRDQISLARAGQTRTINVRVTTEVTSGDSRGYVITLDDITDLVTAQRTSAWADVARRIAHEIKNPLTPIQLSAERLKRKFGGAILTDRAIFEQCTDTIIRQVGDIGRMVDEFSAFARMPKPALAEHDLRETLREAVILMQVGYPEIDIELAVPEERMTGRFDRRMISQGVTNLIKNAAEAIAAVSPAEPGRIDVVGRFDSDWLVIDVIDNGVGLPPDNRERLLEPYMTTREKGTGLGLAIVRKIVEEHAGRIELLDAPSVAAGGHGALVRVTFPMSATEAAGEPVLKAAG